MQQATAVSPAAGDSLSSRWQVLQQQEPKLRIRQLADKLGVSEMELVRLRGEGALIPLQENFGEILTALDDVGPVMILTRNNEVVHEVTGRFHDFTTGRSGAMGLAVGEIDIRMFFKHWVWGYRVQEQVRSGLRESLQFFDQYGMAVHKIYRVDDTDGEAWDRLVQRFSAAQMASFVPQGKRPVTERALQAEVDAEALCEGWSKLKDVHHFGALLKRVRADRLTALELVRGEWATELELTGGCVLECLLERLRDNACPAMFFVGNPGVVQIFTGRVSEIRRTGPWMNVLDTGFNLHANTDEIKRWWLVRRPSSDGVITSVEAFNATGELVLTVFGERKPGISESELWREQAQWIEALS